jgi:hypothetical protein
MLPIFRHSASKDRPKKFASVCGKAVGKRKRLVQYALVLNLLAL